MNWGRIWGNVLVIGHQSGTLICMKALFYISTEQQVVIPEAVTQSQALAVYLIHQDVHKGGTRGQLGFGTPSLKVDFRISCLR